MTTQTTSRVLLNSARDDAKMVLKWADLAAAQGGSFSVVNEYRGDDWYSVIVINWPDGASVQQEERS